MSHKIYNWSEISNNFSDSILLGNGASIGIDERFTYISLKEHAINDGLFTQDVQSLFTFFNTNDFELVLRLVWQANKVNFALSIPDQRTRVAYEHVRDCLIRAVQSIHPEYCQVENQFPDIATFLSQFRTILSLNYDLTLYWIIMYANRECNGHSFKDCMNSGEFDENWSRYRDSISHWDRKTSLIFYPHGSLVLARNVVEREVKLGIVEDYNLLDSILYLWETSNYIPLFVSEGTSEQKVSAIHNSHYLNTVYREVIPSLSGSLAIYGWGFGEHDIHILNRLKLSSVNSIAVSVYGNDQAYCNRVVQMIKINVGQHVDIIFFNSQSSGCWNQIA